MENSKKETFVSNQVLLFPVVVAEAGWTLSLQLSTHARQIRKQSSWSHRRTNKGLQTHQAEIQGEDKNLEVRLPHGAACSWRHCFPCLPLLEFSLSLPHVTTSSGTLKTWFVGRQPSVAFAVRTWLCTLFTPEQCFGLAGNHTSSQIWRHRVIVPQPLLVRMSSLSLVLGWKNVLFFLSRVWISFSLMVSTIMKGGVWF